MPNFGSVKNSEVERRKQGSETLLRGIAALLCFALGITVILGHVKVYEMRLQLEERYEHLSQLQLQLGQKRKASMEDVNQKSNQQGLYAPRPEDYIIVHVREVSEP